MTLYLSCGVNKSYEDFECYTASINFLFKKRQIDTIYIANNFPNFKLKDDEFPQSIFYYDGLIEDNCLYDEIIPPKYFWYHFLLKTIDIKNPVHFKRFNYSIDFKLQEGPNLKRTYLIFSPIYYDNLKQKGFFIVTEANNINIGFTTIFYITKLGTKYSILDAINIHKYLPK